MINRICPKCGRDTVSSNGKGKYHCEQCNAFFRDRRYPVGIQKLAVAIHGLGVSYCDICSILEIGSHRNTVCYWVKKFRDFKDKYTEELIKYMEICKSINAIQERLDILEKNIPIAMAYWKKKKEYMALVDKQDKISRNSPNYTIYALEIDKQHKEILGIKKPIDLMTIEQIEAEITEKTDELENQEQRKNNMKNKGIFANEKYDLDAIIAALGKLLAQKSRPVRTA